MADPDFYEEQFNIRASEIDSNQKATLPALCNLLQEAAGNHAQELQFDITDLQQQQMTWVLRRLHIVIHRFPDWRETVTVRTWPSGGDGLRAYRDFLLLDEDEQIIGRSLSYWLILDIEKRRPIRIPEAILKYVPPNKDHVIPNEGLNFDDDVKAEQAQIFSVRPTDLDLNEHVNNVRLIEWALSCLPEDSNTTKLDIKFTNEAVLDDTIVAEHASTNDDYVQLRRQSDGDVIAQVITD